MKFFSYPAKMAVAVPIATFALLFGVDVEDVVEQWKRFF